MTVKAGELLLKGISGVMACVVAWAGWATLGLNERPTAAQVSEMIRTQAPYVEDRKAIDAQLKAVAENSNQLREVIEKNTDAIIALKLELSRDRSR